MPRYFFDQKNGRRIVDAVGLKCNDDVGALATAKFIATKIGIDNPKSQKRYVSILNEAGDEIEKVPVEQAAIEGEPA